MSAFAAGALKTIDALLGPAACMALSRPQTAPEARTLGDFPPGAPVLVARPGGLGDAVLLLPSMAALREAFPLSPIDVLCERRNAPVFEMSGLTRRVLRYDEAPAGTLRALRRGGWAVFCDTEQFHHFSAVMGVASRAPVRVGFAVNPARLGLYTRVVPYDSAGREAAQFEGVFRSAAGKASGAPFRAPPLLGLLRGAALPPPPDALPERYVAIHAGASAARKRWSKWDAVVRALRRDFRIEPVFVGTRGDSPGIAGTVDFCGRLPLARTASVLAGAIAMAGTDSGLSHLSVAVGTPAVVLFGPGDPSKWGPAPGQGKCVTAALACSPCSMYGVMKPCRRAWCMEGIGPEQVLAALSSVISPAARPRET